MPNLFETIVNFILSIFVIPALLMSVFLVLMKLHSSIVNNIYFKYVLPKIRDVGRMLYYGIGYVAVWFHEEAHASIATEVYDGKVSPEEGYVKVDVVDEVHDMIVSLAPCFILPLIVGTISILFFSDTFTSSFVRWGWNRSTLGPTDFAKNVVEMFGLQQDSIVAIPLSVFIMVFEFAGIDIFRAFISLLNLNVINFYTWIYIYLITVMGLGSGASSDDWRNFFNLYSLAFFLAFGFIFFFLGPIIILPLLYVLVYGMFVCLFGCLLAYLFSNYVTTVRNLSWPQRIISLSSIVLPFFLTTNILGYRYGFVSIWASVFSCFCTTKMIIQLHNKKAASSDAPSPSKFRKSSFVSLGFLILLILIPIGYYYCPRLAKTTEISRILQAPSNYQGKNVWLFGSVIAILNSTFYEKGIEVEKPLYIILDDGTGSIEVSLWHFREEHEDYEQKIPFFGGKVLVFGTIYERGIGLIANEVYVWDF